MTKKSERLILGSLITAALVLVVGIGIYYAVSVYSTENRVTTTSNLLPRHKGSSLIIVPLLMKNYGFTVNGGIPNFMCYEDRPLSKSSGKEGYVVCDAQVAGSYVAIMWRDVATELTIVQDGMLNDLLNSPGAKETLGEGAYTKKDAVCKKDETFKDTTTGMNGMFVDCVVAPKSAENTAMYISYFYFTPQTDKALGNVAVFSNIGSNRKVDQSSFIRSTRDTIKYLVRAPEVTQKTSFMDTILTKVKQSLLTGIGIEVAYATTNYFGGGCCSNPGGPGGFPSVTFHASPTTVSWNTSATLSWSSSGATSCSASSGWSGSKGLAGTEGTSPIRATTQYGLSCTSGGPATFVQAGVLVCPSNAPVAVADTSGSYLGYSCVTPTGNITSNTCPIATGASSCAMTVAWSTSHPEGVVEVRRPYAGGSVLATSASGSVSATFPYQVTPYTLDLYDTTMHTVPVDSYSRETKLDSALFTATCGTGGWDTFSGTCSDPRVTSIAVTGQWYSSPGTISFTCSNSDAYRVTNVDTNTPISSGVYDPVTGGSAAVTTNGNYAVVCKKGNYAGPQSVVYYNAPPPPAPIVSLTTSPSILAKNGRSIIRWNAQYPTNLCTLTAKAVCTNDVCSASQTAFENAVNQILTASSTDSDDPSTSRLISTAVQTIAPGHTNTDWKALGKKTLTITSTIDLTYNCGGTSKETRRLKVIKNSEQ